jgi:hypothetical protein
LLVWPAVASTIECALKWVVVLRRRERKQRHARPELHIVGRAKNRIERGRFDLEYRPSAEIEAWPKHRMLQIGARLLMT